MNRISAALVRALALAPLAANAWSQEPRRPDHGAPEHRQRPEDEQRERENRSAAPYDLGPERVLEFAVSADSLWLSYRDLFPRALGFTSYSFLAGENDDLAFSARLVRIGIPSRDTPLGLGIGLGLLGASADETNEELLAITLTGNIDYRLDLDYPLRLGFEATYAPNIASFFDGERVLDLSARAELELSSWAFAFAGYRHFEVELDQGGNHDLDSGLHLGVRMGF